MGRIYTVPWTGAILNADGNMDLWEILPADDQPVTLWGVSLGQKTEEGSGEEEMLRITVTRLRATVTSGSGGATGAPEDPSRAGQAPAFGSKVQNDTVATTTGDTEVLDEIAWNVRSTPYERWYPERKFCPKAIEGEALLIRLEDTVTDDMTFAGNIWVEEGP